MKSLLRELDREYPGWRDYVSSDPVEAAIELGLIEPEELDDNVKELSF